MISRALFGQTHALAELGIPVIASSTRLGAADACACLGVPVVARRAHLRPFAQALAFLPVPVLVIRADHGYIAFALAGEWVPNLTLWTQISPWTNASALVEAEIKGWAALNSLLAFASASNWVPVQRRDASQCSHLHAPARIPGHKYWIKYTDFKISDSKAAGRAHACIEVQDERRLTGIIGLIKVAFAIATKGIQF